MAAIYDAIPCGEGGRQRRPGKTLLFDVTHGLAHRAPLTKLAKLNGDIHLYLTTLIVAALAWAGEALVMQKDTQTIKMTREAFNNVLLNEGGYKYDNYWLVSR